MNAKLTELLLIQIRDGRQISFDPMGSTIAHAAEADLIAYAADGWFVTLNGEAWLRQQSVKTAEQKTRAARARQARASMLRSLGMTRTRTGQWE